MLKVFLSHSVTADDYGLVTSIANVIWQSGAQAFIPDWLPRYPEDIHKVSKISAIQIDASDIVLGIITASSNRSAWVQQELAYAQGKGKHIIVLAEEGTNIEPLFLVLEQTNVIRFSRWDFGKTAGQILEIIRQQQQDESNSAALRNLLLLGFGLWILSQTGKSKS